MSEYLTRDQAKEDALFTVETRGGAKFLCRVVSALELFADGVFVPPAVEADMTDEQKRVLGYQKAVEIHAAARKDTVVADKILGRAMVTPALWRGAPEKCPEDQVTLDLLGPYRDDLIDEVLLRLGYGGSRREAVEFRDSAGAHAVAPSDVPSDRGEPAPTA